MLEVVGTEIIEQPSKELKYDVQLLSTKELYDKYWGQCIPLFQECIDRAMDGEITIDQMYEKALKGELWVIAIKNDETEIPTVKLCLALELSCYPQYTAMNVLAMGGRDLRRLIKQFWPQICGWAQVCGVKKMECLVAPAMEKILTAQGFKRKYTLLRQDLTEN